MEEISATRGQAFMQVSTIQIYNMMESLALVRRSLIFGLYVLLEH